jgi:hypothetical protein
MYQDKIRQYLNEAKSDSSSIDSKTINSKEMKAKIESIVKDYLKDNKEIEDKMVEISSNVLTQLYKTLWLKRNVWQGSLKNKSN